jgi:hypothetical protein
MLPRSVGMEWKSGVARISAAVPHAAAHSLGTVSTLPAARALYNWHRKKSLNAVGQKDGVRFFAGPNLMKNRGSRRLPIRSVLACLNG